MVGSGAVFFHLWNTARLPDQVFLFDQNAELINAYLVVRDRLAELLQQLAIHQRQHSREYYYRIRGLDRQSTMLGEVERAARTIYLNRTCYNGLYRVNRRGQFNVPLGSYRNPKILQRRALEAASFALQGVCVELRDFRDMVDVGRPGDFFYIDPPYHPLSATASFTSYTAGSFSEQDQRDLASVFTQLTEKGCLCMLSNSCTPFILELYRQFRIQTVSARRAVNANPRGRAAVEEVVILNF